MITEDRLEELIKQGATIYEAKYGKVNPIDFTKQKKENNDERIS